MTLSPAAQAALEQAIKAIGFDNDAQAVMWLIRYAADGAMGFCEYEVALDLVKTAETLGSCDGDLIRDQFDQQPQD